MDGLVKKINPWVLPPLNGWVGQKNINQWVPLPVKGWVGLHMGPEHAAREKILGVHQCLWVSMLSADFCCSGILRIAATLS